LVEKSRPPPANIQIEGSNPPNGGQQGFDSRVLSTPEESARGQDERMGRMKVMKEGFNAAVCDALFLKVHRYGTGRSRTIENQPCGIRG